MNELLIKDDINIENMIYEIRGKQVMLDSDLAKIYSCVNGTKTINQAVNRHLDRFPNDFYFQITEEEYNSLRSQLGTLKSGRGHHIKYLPYVFTEQGVAMLATVLRTQVASQMSIKIMRAFVAMRHYIGNSEHRISNIESKIIEHDKNIMLLQKSFEKFEEKRKDSGIYFEGQIYDAYSKIVDVLNKAKKELIIIDGYADKTVLDIISNLKIPVTLIVKTKSLLTKLDIEKYNEQYNNLTIKYDDTYHDRYFILDKKIIYHCGTSINYAGFKTFSINLLNDESITKPLINKINKII